MTLLSLAPRYRPRIERRPMRKGFFFEKNPLINIRESTDSFVIEMALPGLQKTQVNIDIANDVLSIDTNHESNPSEQWIRKEFDYSKSSKSFEIPDSVNQAEITANMKDGILTVELPKKEEAKIQPPKNIEIK